MLNADYAAGHTAAVDPGLDSRFAHGPAAKGADVLPSRKTLKSSIFRENAPKVTSVC